jgi:hypothetical protein
MEVLHMLRKSGQVPSYCRHKHSCKLPSPARRNLRGGQAVGEPPRGHVAHRPGHNRPSRVCPPKSSEGSQKAQPRDDEPCAVAYDANDRLSDEAYDKQFDFDQPDYGKLIEMTGLFAHGAPYSHDRLAMSNGNSIHNGKGHRDRGPQANGTPKT